MVETIETKEEFHRRKSKEHYQKYKKQYNERNKAQRDRTMSIINEAKSSGCIICGEDFVQSLDLHHVNSDKDYEVSSMKGMNDQKVLAEIAKCVVLCRNCHAKVHVGYFSLLNK